MRMLVFLCLSMIMLVVLGCAESSRPTNVELSSAGAWATKEASRADASAALAPRSMDGNEGVSVSGQIGADEKLAEQIDDAGKQIIHTAHLSIIVEQFDSIPERIGQLVESHGGYISDGRIGQMQGSKRSGSWTIRVPVERYREFLSSASGIGTPESLSETAEDVSEEFVDLEARITSSKKLEEQISKLLERDTGKIEDLVAIERELARVRLEIERMEGRLRFLSNRVAMSTVHLKVSEQITFVPAAQPSLGNRIRLEWSEAVGRTGRALESMLLGCVANAFVIVVWIVGLFVVWIVFQSVRRRYRRATPQAQTVAT